MRTESYSSYESSTNSVLRNAFLGVGVELSVYSIAMFIGMAMGLNGLMVSIGFWAISFILLMILPKFSNSMKGFGIANLVALFLGLSSAPALSYYIGSGYIDQVLMSAITTAAITYGLSMYAQISKKDFSYLGGAIFAIILAMIVIGLLNVFLFKSPMLSLIMSFVGVIIFSLAILFEVSMVVNNKNGNWIEASVGIFISVVNLFWSILRIMTAFSGDD